MAAAAALVLPAGALASTASVEGNTLRLVSAPGESDTLLAITSDDTDYYRVTGFPHLPEPGAGCTAFAGTLGGPPELRCTKEGVGSVVVELGDGNDSGSVTAPVPATINGDDGNDVLVPPLTGLADGGAGNDRFESFTRPTGAELDGGDGVDTIAPEEEGYPDFSDWSIDLLAGVVAAGSTQWGAPVTGVENAYGTVRRDYLHGDDGPNVLRGGDERDMLAGLGGDDTIDSRDHRPRPDHGRDRDLERPDLVSCGAGADQVKGDAADAITHDCENVLVFVRYGHINLVILNGDASADRLRGNPAQPNRILGRGGDDVIRGGRRRDDLSGGRGDDVLRSAGDGVRDAVSCGVGRDRVVADAHDGVARDCEVVRR